MSLGKIETDVQNDLQWTLPPPAELLSSLEDYQNVTAWINDLLDGNTDGNMGDAPEESNIDLPELERRVTQLSATLDVACEDTSTQLERNIDEIARTVPRLTYDLQLMRESALSLQHSLHDVESRSKSSVASEDTAGALERLHFLDTVKRNMEASLTVLREAESWSSLESEVVAFIAEQAYSKAAARLSEASKSLAVFQNTPEYEARKTMLVNLQNQLEASLSSALVSAIGSQNIDSCKAFYQIFCDIEREAEFRGYWNGSKRKDVVAVWESAVVQDCDEQLREENQVVKPKLSALLSEFFQGLLNVLQAERVSAMMIFPDPQTTLSTFITSTLASLHPPPAQRLSALVSHYGNTALVELISVYKVTEEFALAVDKLMEKTYLGQAAPSTSPGEERESPVPPKSHQRRKSQRKSMSMSRRMMHRGSSSVSGFGNALGLSGPSNQDRSWDDALFEAFLDYISDYASLEKKLLGEQLQAILHSPGSSTDGARLLRERSVDVFALADDALQRCQVFTSGFGVACLIQALDYLFDQFLSASRNDLLKQDPRTATSLSADDDFAELDYTPEDYASFQLARHLLEVDRGLLERLVGLERQLRSNLLQTSHALRMARNDPLGFYFTGKTRGTIGLLQTSSLNSAELQSLIDLIDPDPQQTPGPLLMSPNPAGLSAARQHNTGSSSAPLLHGARKAISDLARHVQTSLQSTLLSPLYKHLSAYASATTIWSAPGDPKNKRQGAGGINEAIVPTFSLSYTQTIQRVAEGLLNLPRLFEVYADDDALAFSIETLPFVDAEKLKEAAARSALAANEWDESSKETLRPARPGHRLSSPSQSLTILPPAPQSFVLTPEAVSLTWVASLTLSFLSHFTGIVLPAIKALSPSGAAQLTEDLEYMDQIIKAINVDWEPLQHWKMSVSVDEEAITKFNTQETTPAQRDILRHVCRIRGLNISL